MFVATLAVVLSLSLSSSAFAGGYASASALLTFTVDHALTITGQEVDYTGLTQGQCYTFTTDGYIQPAPEGWDNTAPIPPLLYTVDDANPNDVVEFDFILPNQAVSVGTPGIGSIALSDWVFGYDPAAAGVSFTVQQAITGPVTAQVNPGGGIFLGWKACVGAGVEGATDTFQADVILEAHYVTTP